MTVYALIEELRKSNLDATVNANITITDWINNEEIIRTIKTA